MDVASGLDWQEERTKVRSGGAHPTHSLHDQRTHRRHLMFFLLVMGWVQSFTLARTRATTATVSNHETEHTHTEHPTDLSV